MHFGDGILQNNQPIHQLAFIVHMPMVAQVKLPVWCCLVQHGDTLAALMWALTDLQHMHCCRPSFSLHVCCQNVS